MHQNSGLQTHKAVATLSQMKCHKKLPTRKADRNSACRDAAGGRSKPPASHASPQGMPLASPQPQTPKWEGARWPSNGCHLHALGVLAAGTKTPLSVQEQLLIMISWLLVAAPAANANASKLSVRRRRNLREQAGGFRPELEFGSVWGGCGLPEGRMDTSEWKRCQKATEQGKTENFG